MELTVRLGVNAISTQPAISYLQGERANLSKLSLSCGCIGYYTVHDNCCDYILHRCPQNKGVMMRAIIMGNLSKNI